MVRCCILKKQKKCNVVHLATQMLTLDPQQMANTAPYKTWAILMPLLSRARGVITVDPDFIALLNAIFYLFYTYLPVNLTDIRFLQATLLKFALQVFQ